MACIGIDELSLSSEIVGKVRGGYNILMPLNTPDRAEKVYLVGKADEPRALELLTAILTVNAQAIEDECSLYAFVNTFSVDVSKAREIWAG